MLVLISLSLIISSNNFIPKKDIQSFVYHIELENNYHYVGITKNLNERWSQHVIGKVGKLSHLHKPKKIVNFWTNGTEKIKNKKIYELMDKYGVDKVIRDICDYPILKDYEQFGYNNILNHNLFNKFKYVLIMYIFLFLLYVIGFLFLLHNIN
mgnify:CR=1 FL=1